MSRHLGWFFGLVGGTISRIALASDSTLPIQGTDPSVLWDDLYHFLVILSAIFFVLVVGAMIYFAYRYRGSAHPRSKYITGNHLLEGIWIAVPTVLLMVIFGWGYWVYRDMTQAPSDAYEIRVVGKQWQWQFFYDSHEPTYGELFVPMNRPVKLIMTSEDVLHSFFVPNFRVKQDVVPGMYTSVWFEARVPGQHQVYCAEYCGGNHSGMLAKVVVLNDAQWKAFAGGAEFKASQFPLAGSGAQPMTVAELLPTSQAAPVRVTSMADRGRHLFESKGCVSCHNPAAPTQIGPSHKGLYLSTVELQDGRRVKADENYIRESIERPQAKLVKGYTAVMPTFKGQMNEREMAEVIAYIKSL